MEGAERFRTARWLPEAYERRENTGMQEEDGRWMSGHKAVLHIYFLTSWILSFGTREFGG